MLVIVGNEMNALKASLGERMKKTVKMVQSASQEVRARQEQYTDEHGDTAVRLLSTLCHNIFDLAAQSIENRRFGASKGERACSARLDRSSQPCRDENVRRQASKGEDDPTRFGFSL